MLHFRYHVVSLLLLVRPGRKLGMPFFFSHADGLVIQKGSNFRIQFYQG